MPYSLPQTEQTAFFWQVAMPPEQYSYTAVRVASVAGILPE